VIQTFAFGPWLPDQADYQNAGLEICENVLPGSEGYRPAKGPGGAVADVEAAVLSARMFERADGTRVVVAATASDLHVIINGTDTPSTLSLTLTSAPVFERFGATIYASSKQGLWQLANIESSTTFVAMAVSCPFGASIARVGDFLVAGNLTDIGSTDAPYRVRWSGFNNPQVDWSANVGRQSGSVDMPENYGRVMALAGGTSGLVLQRNGISRLYYVGGATVFAKDVVDRERGCVAARSVVQVGGLTYFLADDGFFVTDGSTSRPISRRRVWQWWLDNSAQTYAGSVEGAVDWNARCIHWTIMGAGGAKTGLLTYNWETEWFSTLQIEADTLIATGQDGVTLETVAATYTNLDTMPVSLDSVEFLPRERMFGIFDGGEMKMLNGNTLRASWGTGDFQPAPGRRVYVRSVTPLMDGQDGSTYITLSGRGKQNGGQTQTTTRMGPLGFAALNFDTRYLRVTISTAPDGAGDEWREAFGYEMDFDVAGLL
jgi:hypothetical protein